MQSVIETHLAILVVFRKVNIDYPTAVLPDQIGEGQIVRADEADRAAAHDLLHNRFCSKQPVPGVRFAKNLVQQEKSILVA